MDNQTIAELGMLLIAIKYPASILATLVFVASTILGSKDALKDAKDIKDLYK